MSDETRCPHGIRRPHECRDCFDVESRGTPGCEACPTPKGCALYGCKDQPSPDDKSSTPRTDAAIEYPADDLPYVRAHVAQELERELSLRSAGVAIKRQDALTLFCEIATRLEADINLSERTRLVIHEFANTCAQRFVPSASALTTDGVCNSCGSDLRPGLGWALMSCEHDRQVLALCDEVEAMRRGVAVTYPTGGDPVKALRLAIGTREDIDRREATIRSADSGINQGGPKA